MPSLRKIAAGSFLFAFLLLFHGILTWKMHDRTYNLPLFWDDVIYVVFLFWIVVFVAPRMGRLAGRRQGGRGGVRE